MSSESDSSLQVLETVGGPPVKVVRVDELSSTIQLMVNEALLSWKTSLPVGALPTMVSSVAEATGGKYATSLSLRAEVNGRQLPTFNYWGQG